MPAITPIVATNATGGTMSSGTFADASCTTSALTNGVVYLVLALSSHSTEGAFPTTSGSEMEARFGTTRYAASSFVGAFANFNAGDTANGGILQAAFTVTGDGSSTLNMRVRRVGGSDTVRWGSAQFIAIPLTALTLNTDYWVAEASNSDSSEVIATDATWVTGASGGQLGFTPASSGDYLIVASSEGFISGTLGTQETFRARLRQDATTTIGTGTETSLDVDAATSAGFGPSFFAIDVVAGTASTPIAFRWEFSNDTAGDACAYRRSRIYAIRLDAFSDYASIVNGGNIVANSGSTDAANALSFNFGTSIPTLILANCSHQNGGAFGQGYLRSGSTNYPADGYMWAVLNGGTGALDDNGWLTFATVQTLTGAQSWFLRGHSDGASDLTYGRDRGNTTSARTPVVAIDLSTPGGGSATGTAAVASILPTVAASGRFSRIGTAAVASILPTVASAGRRERSGTVGASSILPVVSASQGAPPAPTGTVAARSILPTVAAVGRFARSGTVAASSPLPRAVARQSPASPPTSDGSTSGVVTGSVVTGEVVRFVVVTPRT